MRKLIAIAVLSLAAWVVTTYSGQIVAGPFNTYQECQAEAAHLAKQYSNVSPNCKAYTGQ